MQKTTLTIFGALLISGSMVQMAGASEHRHHATKAHVSRHHGANYRAAYDVVRPINASVSSRGVNRTEESFRLPDHSWIGDQDPSMNPSD